MLNSEQNSRITNAGTAFAPNNKQIPMTKTPAHKHAPDGPGVWDFEFEVCLEFGTWNLVLPALPD
jgi:hypothetical protein